MACYGMEKPGCDILAQRRVLALNGDSIMFILEITTGTKLDLSTENEQTGIPTTMC